MRYVALFILSICLAPAWGAKVVLSCEPTADAASLLTKLEVQIVGDELDAFLTLPGQKERAHYDVKVWENPTGYVGQYLELHIAEWDHVTTPANLAVQYPMPTGTSTFVPNLRVPLTCAWQ